MTTEKKYADEFLIETKLTPQENDLKAVTPQTAGQDKNLLYQNEQPQAKSPLPTDVSKLDTIRGNDGGGNTTPAPTDMTTGSDFEQ